MWVIIVITVRQRSVFHDFRLPALKLLITFGVSTQVPCTPNPHWARLVVLYLLLPNGTFQICEWILLPHKFLKIVHPLVDTPCSLDPRNWWPASLSKCVPPKLVALNNEHLTHNQSNLTLGTNLTNEFNQEWPILPLVQLLTHPRGPVFAGTGPRGPEILRRFRFAPPPTGGYHRPGG